MPRYAVVFVYNSVETCVWTYYEQPDAQKQYDHIKLRHSIPDDMSQSEHVLALVEIENA